MHKIAIICRIGHYLILLYTKNSFENGNLFEASSSFFDMMDICKTHLCPLAIVAVAVVAVVI